ncbi:MAG TPA: hypothetical protein VLK25_03505 [Allosphingosinicella sp.]|nr:hypothetical protein [Allosphingosinicella sp.]
MRRLPVLFAPAIAAFIAVPAAAQELGARTQSPESMAAEMRRSSPEQEIAEIAAAADAHPFGTVQNPIRVGGPEGEHAYLGHLRCPDGSQPRIGGRSTAGVGAYGSIVGAYEVSCGGATARIAFDMYHEEHVETRAPAGFSYAP